MLFCSINGVQSQQLTVHDRSIHYGDGVFTTAKINQGSVLWLTQHITRLKRSCDHFGIDTVDWVGLEKEIKILARSFEHNVLKVIISAGESSMGYARGQDCRANTFIMVSEFPTHYQAQQLEGISVSLAQTKLSINPSLAGYKHLNRMEQVLLKQELLTSQSQDLIATNTNGHAVETITGNLFLLIDEHWSTPKLTLSGVEGIARLKLLDRFDNIEVRHILIDELNQATAMFTTNCLMPLLPIKSFNQKPLNVSACKPFLDHLNEIS